MKRPARRLTHAQLSLRAVRCAITEARYAAQLETSTKGERAQWSWLLRDMEELALDVRVRIARARAIP